MKRILNFLGGVFSYFTIWSLIALFLSQYNSHPFLVCVAKTMIFQSSVGGFYIAYIHPTKLFVPYCKIHMKGSMMKFLDLVFHQFPCLVVLYYSYSPPVSNLVSKYIFVLPLLIYLSFFSLEKQYNLRNIDIFRLGFIMLWVQAYL